MRFDMKLTIRMLFLFLVLVLAEQIMFLEQRYCLAQVTQGSRTQRRCDRRDRAIRIPEVDLMLVRIHASGIDIVRVDAPAVSVGGLVADAVGRLERFSVCCCCLGRDGGDRRRVEVNVDGAGVIVAAIVVVVVIIIVGDVVANVGVIIVIIVGELSTRLTSMGRRRSPGSWS
jgi:hypothetical protein